MKTFLIIFIPLLVISLVIISLNNKKKKYNFNGATLKEVKQKLKVAVLFLEEKGLLEPFYDEVNITNKGKKVTTKKELYNYMLQKTLNGEVKYDKYFFDPITLFSNNIAPCWDKLGIEYIVFYGDYISNNKKPFAWTNPQETKKQLENARWNNFTERILKAKEC